MLKISVIGQATLASATAECCLRHFEVYRAPWPNADIVWVVYDTPIDMDDKPDSDWVIDRIRELMVDLGTKPLILVSSQMPVGTTAKLEQEFPAHSFAHSPENIRVATAVADFTAQSRIVVGVRTDRHNEILEELFKPFTSNLIITDPETAEMTKHAVNSFMALQIAFVNELAKISGSVGANASIVSLALRADERVSPKAPLRPGSPYGGGHLARDIYTLNQIAKERGISVPIIGHIKESNDAHS